MEPDNNYTRLWDMIKRYVSLNIENVKLSAAEKITLVLSAMAMIMGGVLLGVTLLFFLSLAVVQFIAPYLGMGWAYMIMAGFVALLFIVVYLLRKPLIYNPVARFISRVVLK